LGAIHWCDIWTLNVNAFDITTTVSCTHTHTHTHTYTHKSFSVIVTPVVEVFIFFVVAFHEMCIVLKIA
jgi:hypothetical protein